MSTRDRRVIRQIPHSDWLNSHKISRGIGRSLRQGWILVTGALLFCLVFIVRILFLEVRTESLLFV